jgi:hypothetical protein
MAVGSTAFPLRVTETGQGHTYQYNPVVPDLGALAGTATAADMIGGIIVGTPGAGVALTIDTATNINAALPSLAVGQGITFKAINLSGANAYTITAPGDASVILVGNVTIAASTSKTMILYKTAAGYNLYI